MIGRTALLAILLLGVSIGGCHSVSKCFNECCMTAPTEVVRHVVVFKFNDGTPATKVLEIVDGFRKLKDRIPGIIDFEWGTNVSPEGLDQGFTHCFRVTFPDTAARDAYLPHPAHKEFVALLKPHLERVFVVDYVAGN